ncbi:MAG TPA: penicillin-binding transpeptidase domain-containing protein [Acidimicrobiales bacterium]|nr:penicillin-binding transpeptidase domain-containing protein [Acidimicrobiales bacterium]
MSKGWRQRGLPRLTSIPWPSFRLTRGVRITERRASLPNPLAAPEDVGARPVARLWVVGAVFAVLFAFMGVRLAFLQLADHAAAAATVQLNTLRTVSVPAPRGEIVSRQGTKLVANTFHQELVLSRLQADSVPGLIGRVAALAGLPPAAVSNALNNQQYDPYQPVPILTDTPTKVIIYLETHRAMFPGVSVETLTERTYPAGGDLAPQLLGYVGPITAQQYAVLASKGYSMNSIVGKDGIEAYYEPYLKGKDGTQVIQVDANGDPVQVVQNNLPTVGDTVVLNLDASLQSFLSNALAQDIYRVRATIDPRSGRYPSAPNGAAIVLDPRNGHVLAMASFPSYNLDVWKGGISQANYNALLNSSALNNNVTAGLYIPGSTFKLVTATAAMQDHLISPNQYVDDTGKFVIPNCRVTTSACSFTDDEKTGLGFVNLPLALTESSDYYFYNLGYQFWNAYTNLPHYRYGETPIQDVAAAYGLAAPTGVDLPYESASIVDSPKVRIAEHKACPSPTCFPNWQWYTGDNIEMAFGQGGTVLTPIGLANAYATFANGGKRFTPEVAAAIVSSSGHVVQRYMPKLAGTVSLPPSVRDPILQGLLGAVNNPHGTAYATFHQYANFNLAAFPIAGKTGTASIVKGQEPNSWFVGFGPVGHPRYVVLCVIAHGGYGADAAAPVVAQTFDYLVQHPVGPLRLPSVHRATAHTSTTGTSTTSTTRPATRP